MDADELRTRRLVIEAPDGNPRVVIAADDDRTLLTLLDTRSQPRFTVGINEHDVLGAAAVLTLMDYRGRPRWAVGVLDNEEPFVVVYDADGRPSHAYPPPPSSSDLAAPPLPAMEAHTAETAGEVLPDVSAVATDGHTAETAASGRLLEPPPLVGPDQSAILTTVESPPADL